MTSTSKPMPEPAQTITPYLTVRDAARAIEFYKDVFRATEIMRLAEPGGRIGHAELKLGNSTIMLSDEYPELDALGPQSRGGTTFGMHIMVGDADAVFDKAVAAGAKSIRPVKDEFYGERSGKISDSFGHVWYISMTIESLSAEDVQQRYDKLKGH